MYSSPAPSDSGGLAFWCSVGQTHIGLMFSLMPTLLLFFGLLQFRRKAVS